MAKKTLQDILSENVRAYRAKHGLSQDEFADRCGLHRTYIGSVELAASPGSATSMFDTS